MWHPHLPRHFCSWIRAEDEQDCTGKWLVPIPLGDPEGLWTRIKAAVHGGRLTAAKHSHPDLDAILGHHLVCVYWPDSHEATARKNLNELRALGVTCPVTYKTDKATVEDREDKLYTSTEFELVKEPENNELRPAP